MKPSLLQLALLFTVGLAVAGCATRGSSPQPSASTGPSGVGTTTQTGMGDVGGLGTGVGVGSYPGGN